MLPDNVLLMARVLILYGTTDGHTRKIATALREALVDEGVYAFISDARYGTETVVAEDYDGVIVAASIHAGGFQRPVTRWVRKQAAELNRMPTAFLAVCLGILEKRSETRRTLDEIMRRIVAKAGGDTDTTRDFEYTNWTDVRVFAQAFGRSLERETVRPLSEEF